MTSRSYAKFLDKALKPFGFSNSRREWIRVRGDLHEVVEIQTSWISGRTINLYVKDLETEKLYIDVFRPGGVIQMPAISARIGQLIDKHERWWGDEPNGPQDMAEVTVRVGLPWFDRVRTLEQQAANWYGRYSQDDRGYHAPSMIGLALTLYRMGELAEACEVLDKPVPRTASPQWAAKVARLREWLGRA